MTAAKDLLRQSRSETRGPRTVVSLLIFEVSSEIESMREVIQVILIGVNISLDSLSEPTSLNSTIRSANQMLLQCKVVCDSRNKFSLI